jgi:hypothetical protein
LISDKENIPLGIIWSLYTIISFTLIFPLLCSTKYKDFDERQTELSSYLIFLTESSLFQSLKINSPPFIANLSPLFLLSTLGLKMARLLRSEILKFHNTRQTTNHRRRRRNSTKQHSKSQSKNTIAKVTETTHTMSSQQQQQQSKRKRDPSPATDESGPTKPQTTKAKVNDDKKIDGKFIHNTVSL